MEPLTINRDIPIYKSDSKYEWIKDLKEGDSFIWPKALAPNLRQTARRFGIKIVQRHVNILDEDDREAQHFSAVKYEGFVRVWISQEATKTRERE